MPHLAVSYRLGIVSTYLPRQCGLATYTADLREALGVATDDLETVVVAIDRDGLSYGAEVVATIDQDRVEDYTAAAAALRAAGVQVVLIQHEYGIFGGEDGTHILAFARALSEHRIPFVVTLHTVLNRPTQGQATTLRELCARAARVTVFTETARRVAIRTGVASGHQLVVMPHGAPEVMRTPPPPTALRPEFRDLFARLEGKPTLTTFGLLSEGKGIDVSIAALARVVERHPETQYVVAGATHPEVKRLYGEAYRQSLVEQVVRLGLVYNVHFLDRFLTLDELSALLNRSTVFVTPYRSPEQICSGALTFALGAGLPAISSAYSYAEDMLAQGAGHIVPCGDVTALAAAISELLGDEAAMASAKAAAQRCADWLPWPAVAAREAQLFREVVAQAHMEAVRPSHSTTAVAGLNLTHLDRSTDEIGIIQFAAYDKPDPESGYCVDDVARLAIVAADILAVSADPRQTALANRWLRQSMRFLIAAYDPSGAMHNVLSYRGTWQDEPHLGDHVGRAVWALGVLVGTPAVPDEIRRPAAALLDELADLAGTIGEVGLRSAAYALIGFARAERRGPSTTLLAMLGEALHGETLHGEALHGEALHGETLRGEADPADGWYWFEPELTYDNARLPQAMLAGAALVGDARAADRALAALNWYTDHVGLAVGTLRCVGNHWHRRGDARESWLGDDGDEQPLDAAAIVEALVDAWQYTGDPAYARLAGYGFGWFLGRNRAGARLYVDESGACHDGLSATGANGNQGAESTLAYHQAVLSLLRAGLAALPHTQSTVNAGRTGVGPAIASAAGTSGTRAGSATPPTTRLTTGHRTRTTEDHTDAR